MAPAESVWVDSAGTHGYHVGSPPDPRSIDVARAHVFDIGDLRARRLTPADGDAFDHIVVMDERNHTDALAILPAASHCKVSLLMAYAPDLGQREVPDPYYGSTRDFERMIQLIEPAVKGLLAQLNRG